MRCNYDPTFYGVGDRWQRLIDEAWCYVPFGGTEGSMGWAPLCGTDGGETCEPG